MGDAPDFAAEGLLDGLTDERRCEARLELLTELHASGVPLEELCQAVAEERLALVPVELVLREEGRYTDVEVAERAGLPVERLRLERQALGLATPEPGAHVYTDQDLEAAQRARRFREAGFPEGAGTDLLRVIGESMARTAEAVRTMFASTARPQETERDLGLRYAELARRLAPELGATLEYVVLHHLRTQIREDVIARVEGGTEGLIPGAREVGVAFADLVGFTRLGTEVPAGELGEVAGRLARMATDVAEPPVRLVKTIGDAAMLVAPDAQALLEAILALVDAAAAEGEEFPALRAGVAWGPALNRAGDWYGHTVNLASRVAATARPESILATEEVHDALKDAYRWSFAGERRLKGIKQPVKLFRARRTGDDDD